MFKFLRKNKFPDWTLDSFKSFRHENADSAAVFDAMIAVPIQSMCALSKNEFLNLEKQVFNPAEALNIVVHYTPKKAIIGMIEMIDRNLKTRPHSDSMRHAAMFNKEFWREVLYLPSMEDGGKADFSVLNNAKPESYKEFESEFVNMFQSPRDWAQDPK